MKGLKTFAYWITYDEENGRIFGDDVLLPAVHVEIQMNGDKEELKFEFALENQLWGYAIAENWNQHVSLCFFAFSEAQDGEDVSRISVPYINLTKDGRAVPVVHSDRRCSGFCCEGCGNHPQVFYPSDVKELFTLLNWAGTLIVDPEVWIPTKVDA